MNKPEFYSAEHKEFLDDLRDSGITNMFGAVPYIREAFSSLDRRRATEVLQYWMESFNEGETK